ncbi:MAG: protease inhibitor Inh/omp19 family protein [Beijerinckiaceae bacterium]|nr:protease inhibitor Inh/omp19 family protein [Beijerinckiaceae bacterium]
MTNVSPRARNALAAMGAFVAASLLIGADAGAAVDLSATARVAGQWDMSLDDTNRKCRFVLRDADDRRLEGLPLAVPAGCRRALPILADVGQWSLDNNRSLRLEDAEGGKVLEFSPDPASGALLARGPEGETYQLISAADAAQTPRRDARQQVAQTSGFRVEETPAGAGFQPRRETEKPLARQNAPVVATSAAPNAAAMRTNPAGRYAPLRDAGKDTGCMVTLDDKSRGPKGTNRAQLAPACRDQGLVIFDPVGWQIERGRLSLMARKGHKAHFDRQPDGVWLRDPKEGKTLSLRPM